jgi:hypothetical protein
MNALRVVGAVLAGLLVGFILISIVELSSLLVYPLPPGLDLRNETAVNEWAQTLPPAKFAFVLGAWLVGTFAAAWLATRIARSPMGGFIVGALLLAAGVFNMLKIPHPAWVWAAGIAIFIASTFFATRVASTSGRTDAAV